MSTSKITRPMLASSVKNTSDLRFPLLATPKLDGVRALVIDGHAVTRKFKPIPNKYIRAKIEHYCPDGFDGEIMSGNLEFNDLQSLVMTEEGEPDFEYHVFDYVKDDLTKPYKERVLDLEEHLIYNTGKFVVPLIPKLVNNHEDLLKAEKQFLDAEYEGIIVRSPDSPYKCGRSTLREGYLLKLKRIFDKKGELKPYHDGEAKILGVENLLHNSNKKEVDELGYTKRSKKKANLIPTNKLGAFVVQDLKTKVQFKVSTGMTDEQRLTYWKAGTTLIGKIVKYKYQGISKTRPRFPVFLGFRDPRDL